MPKTPSRPLPPIPSATISTSGSEPISMSSKDNSWSSELSSFAFMSNVTELNWDQNSDTEPACAREMFSIKRNSQLNVMTRISEESERPDLTDASSNYDSSCSSFVSATESLQDCQILPSHAAGQSEVMRAEKYNISFEDWEALADEIAQAIAADSSGNVCSTSTSCANDARLLQRSVRRVPKHLKQKPPARETLIGLHGERLPVEAILAIVSQLSLPDLWLSARLVSKSWNLASEQVAHSPGYVDHFCSLYLKEVRMVGRTVFPGLSTSDPGCIANELFCRVCCLSVSHDRAALKVIPCQEWQPIRLSWRMDHYAGLSFRSEHRWAETSGNLADNEQLTITVNLDKTYKILAHGA